jgi:hypothetical protein
MDKEEKNNNKQISQIQEKQAINNDMKEGKTDNLKDGKKKIIGTIHKYTLNELEQLINYKYNEKGELVHKTTGQKCGRIGTQEEYELVGKYVEKYIENYLIQNFNLTTLYVPNKSNSDFIKRDESQAQCKILTTADFPVNQRCLMIIQGAGPVRMGQWARSICINDNIYLGTVIPYVDRAIKNNISVIIFNPNERTDYLDDKRKIEEFPTHEEHSLYVYKNIVKNNKNIKEIYILAHSVGGDCALEILLKNREDLLSGRIKKIAFTDSVHTEEYKQLGKKGIKKFRQISRNFICSNEPVGTFVRGGSDSKGGVDCYSSGHYRHEYTSGYAINAIFQFFKEQEDKNNCNCLIF